MGQNFHDFVTELKRLSSECDFGNQQDSLIKDMIVCGTRDNSFPKKLLRECDLIPFKAISCGHFAVLKKHVSMPANFKYQPTANIEKIFKMELNKPSYNTPNQNTKWKFAIFHIHKATT